jgi:hypothetical protein
MRQYLQREFCRASRSTRSHTSAGTGARGRLVAGPEPEVGGETAVTPYRLAGLLGKPGGMSGAGERH